YQLMLPLAGDWERLGHDTPGGVRDSAATLAWTLSNHNSSGGIDLQFTWGVSGTVRVVGDWDGNGTDTPAWFRDGVWTFSNVNTIGGTAATFRWGRAGDIPLAGDWDGDGFDTVGLYRDGEWSLSDDHVAALHGTTDAAHATAFRWGTE
ncbi:MAG TPA: hypothetical protein VK607_18245, partial [Kofleriaceae bacterium]|nr:hypothetical protein [Kofleriaceae bacterium]